MWLNALVEVEIMFALGQRTTRSEQEMLEWHGIY